MEKNSSQLNEKNQKYKIRIEHILMFQIRFALFLSHSDSKVFLEICFFFSSWFRCCCQGQNLFHTEMCEKLQKQNPYRTSDPQANTHQISNEARNDCKEEKKQQTLK